MKFAASVVDGIRWVIVIVFVLSAAEKGSTLHARAAKWHPILMISPRRRARARTLMVMSFAADLTTILLLVVAVEVGAWLAAWLTVAYTIAAWPSYRAGDSSCRCFLGFINTTTRIGFVGRNVILTVLALALAMIRQAQASIMGPITGALLFCFLLSLTRFLDRSATAEATQKQGRMVLATDD